MFQILRHNRKWQQYTNCTPYWRYQKTTKRRWIGIEEFDRPCLDELQMIQDEDGFIKVEKGGDKFSLTQKGINRCIELAIQQ